MADNNNKKIDGQQKEEKALGSVELSEQELDQVAGGSGIEWMDETYRILKYIDKDPDQKQMEDMIYDSMVYFTDGHIGQS